MRLFLIPITLLVLTALFFPQHVSGGTTVQSLVFARIWGGPGSEVGRGVTMDSHGAVYVAGEVGPPGEFTYGLRSALLLKFDSAGSLVWAKEWSGTLGASAYGVAVGPDDHIYVTGSTVNTATSLTDVFLLSFDPSGSLVWQLVWGGRYNDYGRAVTTDSAGDIYVTGETYSFGIGAPANSSIFVLKFSSYGSLILQKISSSGLGDGGEGIAVDSSGKIDVTGYTGSCASGSSDVFIMQLNSYGDLQWVSGWGGNNVDAGSGVLGDSTGNIIVVGSTRSFSAANGCGTGNSHVLLLKFDRNGALLSQRLWGGSGNDQASAIARDTSGNLYLTGATDSFSANNTDSFFLKFNAAGDLVLQRAWGGSGLDQGFGLAGDAQNSVLVTGEVNESGPYNFTEISGFLNTTSLAAHIPRIRMDTPQGFVSKLGYSTSSAIGNQSYSGGSDVFLYRYGVDLFPVELFLNMTPGRIRLNTTEYLSGENVSLISGVYPVEAMPYVYEPLGFAFIDYYPFFSNWTTTGGVTAQNPTLNPTNITVTGAGTLTANYRLVRTSQISPTAIGVVIGVVTTTVAILRRGRGRKSHPSVVPIFP